MMGHPDKITPDIIEWLVTDEKVVSRWKNFATRLGLEIYVSKIDKDYSYKNKKFDKQKMKDFLEVWRIASPITYTKHRLMDILRREELNEMYMWLQLLNTENSAKRIEIANKLDSSRQSTPRSASSLSPQPSQQQIYSNNLTYPGGKASLNAYSDSLPSSPYSWLSEKPTLSDSSNSSMKEHGILKKRPTHEVDYGFLGFSDPNQSRDSTPDSSNSKAFFRTNNTKTSVLVKNKPKTIRFADDIDVAPVEGKTIHTVKVQINNVGRDYAAEKSTTNHRLDELIKSTRKSDFSVDKYFDNLISMIEDAAEGL